MSGVNRLMDDKDAVCTLIAKNQQRFRGIIGWAVERGDTGTNRRAHDQIVIE